MTKYKYEDTLLEVFIPRLQVSVCVQEWVLGGCRVVVWDPVANRAVRELCEFGKFDYSTCLGGAFEAARHLVHNVIKNYFEGRKIEIKKCVALDPNVTDTRQFACVEDFEMLIIYSSTGGNHATLIEMLDVVSGPYESAPEYRTVVTLQGPYVAIESSFHGEAVVEALSKVLCEVKKATNQHRLAAT